MGPPGGAKLVMGIKKEIQLAIQINMIDKRKINKATLLVESVAKLCTELNNPERTKKVPIMLRIKVL
jgi:hypothetical protein